MLRGFAGRGRMRPTLVLNPVTDRAFSEFAHDELENADSPSALERQLRTRYPHAVVHARVLSGERTTIWYVYRDGHWTNSAREGA